MCLAILAAKVRLLEGSFCSSTMATVARSSLVLHKSPPRRRHARIIVPCFLLPCVPGVVERPFLSDPVSRLHFDTVSSGQHPPSF